jgi:drug/metabolite transporter (DMT)-like permease
MFGHTVYNWALKYVRASVVSVSLLGEPIGSSILAYLLLQESPPAITILGGAIILAGIYMTAFGQEETGAQEV